MEVIPTHLLDLYSRPVPITVCWITLAAVLGSCPTFYRVRGAARVVQVDYVPIASRPGFIDGLEFFVGALGSPSTRIWVFHGTRNKR